MSYDATSPLEVPDKPLPKIDSPAAPTVEPSWCDPASWPEVPDKPLPKINSPAAPTLEPSPKIDTKASRKIDIPVPAADLAPAVATEAAASSGAFGATASSSVPSQGGVIASSGASGLGSAPSQGGVIAAPAPIQSPGQAAPAPIQSPGQAAPAPIQPPGVEAAPALIQLPGQAAPAPIQLPAIGAAPAPVQPPIIGAAPVVEAAAPAPIRFGNFVVPIQPPVVEAAAPAPVQPPAEVAPAPIRFGNFAVPIQAAPFVAPIQAAPFVAPIQPPGQAALAPIRFGDFVHRPAPRPVATRNAVIEQSSRRRTRRFIQGARDEILRAIRSGRLVLANGANDDSLDVASFFDDLAYAASHLAKLAEPDDIVHLLFMGESYVPPGEALAKSYPVLVAVLSKSMLPSLLYNARLQLSEEGFHAFEQTGHSWSHLGDRAAIYGLCRVANDVRRDAIGNMQEYDNPDIRKPSSVSTDTLSVPFAIIFFALLFISLTLHSSLSHLCFSNRQVDSLKYEPLGDLSITYKGVDYEWELQFHKKKWYKKNVLGKLTEEEQDEVILLFGDQKNLLVEELQAKALVHHDQYYEEIKAIADGSNTSQEKVISDLENMRVYKFMPLSVKPPSAASQEFMAEGFEFSPTITRFCSADKVYSRLTEE